MSSMTYSFLQTSRGKEPKVRERFTSDDFIEYTILGEDVRAWPNFPLKAVASKFFSDVSKWDVIADVNDIKPPWEWAIGDTIKIPRNYLEAVAPKSVSSIIRKFY